MLDITSHGHNRYAGTTDGTFAASWIKSVCESLGLEVEVSPKALADHPPECGAREREIQREKKRERQQERESAQ